MKLYFSEDGWDDYQHWVRNEPTVLNKVNALIEGARRNLFRAWVSRSR